MFAWKENRERRERFQSLLTVPPTINYCKLEVEYGSRAKFLVFVGFVLSQCIYKEVLFKGVSEFFFWAAIWAFVFSIFNKCYWYTVGLNNKRKLYSATSYSRYGIIPRTHYHVCRWIGAIGVGMTFWLFLNALLLIPFGNLFENKNFCVTLFLNGHFEYFIPATILAFTFQKLFTYFKYFLIKDLPFYVAGTPGRHHVKTGPVTKESSLTEADIESYQRSSIQRTTYQPPSNKPQKVYAQKPKPVEPKPFEKAKPIILPDIYNQNKKNEAPKNKDLTFSRTPRGKKD